MSAVQSWYRRSLTALNARAKHAAVAAPIPVPRLFGSVHQFFQMRQLVRSCGLHRSPCFSHRVDLYAHSHAMFVGNRPMDYLEFGVFTGTSLRNWLALNHHPDSRFYGFDTFEGLPETWSFTTGSVPKGRFSTGGQLPDIHDPRVTFIKGLFQQTVGPFVSAVRVPEYPGSSPRC